MLLLVAGAFALRVGLSLAVSSPDHPDINIYMEAGRLVNVGLNPYDLSQAPDRRELARLDAWAQNDVTCETQELWDYYVSSNLPLSTLLWAAIDRLWPSRWGFAIAFDLLDALAAGLVAAFIAGTWAGPGGWRRRAVEVGIVFAVSPAFLLYGAAISEDKNVSIALVLGGLLACRSRSRVLTLGGAFLLGCAIAYKMVGVFYVVPGLVAAMAPGGAAAQGRRARYVALFGACALAGAAWPFLPFGWPAVERAFARMAYTDGLPNPEHATPWRLLPEGIPLAWRTVRFVVCGSLGGWAVWRALRRDVPLDAFFAFAATVYVGLWLNSGNLDRFGMVVVPAVAILGTHSRRSALRLAAGYFLTAGVACAVILIGKLAHSPAILSRREGFEAVAVALFVAQMAWELRRAAKAAVPAALGHGLQQS